MIEILLQETKILASVPDNRYAVSNGSGYAELISLSEYAVLDRELDTPYPMEVDTPYSAIDQNSTDTSYLLDGYGILVFRIVIFKISLFNLQNAILFLSSLINCNLKCRLPIMWAEVGEGQLIASELVQETTENISQIKDRLKATRDRQKSYADKKRKPLEFSVFKKVGPVAYKLDLPEELDGVHDTFHMSNLKKCLAEPTLQVPLDEIQIDAKLNFVEEPVEILEREFKKLKRSRIAIVKIWWNSKRGPRNSVGT
ncbi:hypothetical protein Tco_0356358 [Tanacetum coccineum]